MKVLKEDDDSFVIYLFSVLDSKKLEDKQEIITLVKNTVLKVNKIYHLNLKGFYKVRVYLNKKVGLVIEIIQVDDISIHPTIDFRVLVYFDQDFYIEVDDYDVLPLHKKVIFVNDKFYIDVCSLDDKEISYLLEFGRVIYKIDEIENFYLGKVIVH